MRTSKADDSNNTLPFHHLKIENHCCRKFKDAIPWSFMAFDFDNVISDHYYCYVIIHVHVKNFEGSHPSETKTNFPIKVGAYVNGEVIDNIGVYGSSGATRGGRIVYDEDL